MKLSDIGEFGLIERIRPVLSEDLPPYMLGIGDDCAVIQRKGSRSMLVTTDLLIEGVHFLADRISAYELGYKSLAVNFSDIAAMGGEPESAFLSIGLPEDTGIDWLDDFFLGIKDLSGSYNTMVAGGDTTQSREGIIINFTVIGSADPGRIKYRSTALPGDLICVTGNLGDSGGGLIILLGGMDENSDPNLKTLVRAHHLPRPHLEEGRLLAAEDGVHAMLDLSDGVDSDIRRVMENSGVGAEIEIEKLPVSPELRNACSRYGWNHYELAAAGGEDYCLMCTVEADSYRTIAGEFRKRFNRELHSIGHITNTGRLQYMEKKRSIDIGKRGWDHFRK
ncbi:MAG: thiamine-phosphate kinase [Candidatus Latescibacteria bacterium]|nr:thiamine-phosphate kinase [bacterium]MBD3424433.1 thiamine-phosphate kinase [Candidatus Latescibacterota bacterium]